MLLSKTLFRTLTWLSASSVHVCSGCKVSHTDATPKHVISFLTLISVADQRGELGVNEVYEVIAKGASQWSSDRLRKFADLRFKYVDEEGNERSYFLPYVYSLTAKGCIPFSEGEKLMADI